MNAYKIITFQYLNSQKIKSMQKDLLLLFW